MLPLGAWSSENPAPSAAAGVIVRVLIKIASKGRKGVQRVFRRGRASTAKEIPQITAGMNREMLGQAVRHVQALEGTAAQKADLFARLSGQIHKLSGGSWSAVRGLGTEGSHVFLGKAGEALIISPRGQLFRGSIQAGGVRIVGPGTFQLDYSLLKVLP